MKLCLMAAALLTANAALAADAGSLFAAGQFAAAADEARMEADADGFTLAARASLVVAAYEVDNKEKALRLIDEAITDANRALRLSPRHVDAIVQKAVALGYRAQLTTSPGTAKRARNLMERAAQHAPSEALVWAALGGWHGESVAELGRFVAGTILGAKRAASIEAYERAIELDPQSPVWRTLYAISLVGMGYGDEEARLRRLLVPATLRPANDAFERLMQVRAERLLAVVDDEDVLEDEAEQARPFARIG